MNKVKPSAASKRPVDVIIVVTRFKDLLADKPSRTGNGSEFVMKLARPHPLAQLKEDNLYLKRPGATIRFALESGGGVRQRFYPLGISFVRERVRSQSEEERLGFLNFPQAATRPEGQILTIVDTYRDKTSGVRYKFSLFIQRGSDGAIGVIDPGIIHTGDH